MAMTEPTLRSHDNVELALRGFETYNRCGVRAEAVRHWHPDVEWQVGPWALALGGQARFRGREAGIAAFDGLEAFMGRFTAEVLDAAEGPEGVFVAVRLHGRGAGSGRPVKRHFWYAIEMDGWRERRIRVCGDPVEALDAVGLGGGRSSRLSYARRPREAGRARSQSALRSRARGCTGC